MNPTVEPAAVVDPTAAPGAPRRSIVHGPPLAEEAGMGALTIPGYLEEVVSRHGDREAVVMDAAAGTVRWSYRQLHEEATTVARALVAAGVGKDSRVGVLMCNRPEYLSALFGVAMAGGVTVSLSTFSTPEELAHLLSASGVGVLLFDESVLKQDFLTMLTDLEPAFADGRPGELTSTRFPFLRRLVALPAATRPAGEPGPSLPAGVQSWADFRALAAGCPPETVRARAAGVTPADAGGIFFSSGTTGLPKGIMHNQRAFTVQWWRWARLFAFSEPVRSWTGNGFFWSANISLVVGSAFSTGGAVILQPTFDPQRALTVMESERVTLPNGRAHQWARLVSAPNWSSVDLSSLRYLGPGSALATHPTVRSEWKQPLAFGTTETMTIMTSYVATLTPEVHAGSYGAPLPGNILRIVDPTTGVVVPQGELGEVCIKGPTLMTGYLGKTLEETFDDEGFYRTGDEGYVDEQGRLFWKGRINEMIKTGGANVSPVEVDIILHSLPGVRRAQTVGVPHDTLGEMVVSCVVPRDGAQIDPEELRAALTGRLASFKIPRHILLFAEEDLSVTGSGKVRLDQLRQLAAGRLAEAGSSSRS